jgi:ABC-type transport system involved in cytochrome c biogenesis permease subunit
MTWYWFNWLAPAAMAGWLAGGFAAVRRKNALAAVLMAAGLAVFPVFIIGLWVTLGRPPMRTMGETRLWYSFFLALAGLAAFRKWQYSWLLAFSAFMASLFAAVNLFRPEIHSIALMPALRSYYFIPHVTTYMLSYSVLAVAAGASLVQLRKRGQGQPDQRLYAFLDDVVRLGLGFLMLGLVSGAAWAKEAWGHYWSWDPKETWAFITAAAYLLYIHLRLRDARPALTLLTLPLGFILLMITWLGVPFLPSASGSAHIYS